MARKKSLLFTIIFTLLLISLLTACSSPAITTPAPTSSAPATTTQAPASTAPATATTTAPAKPQGELVVALPNFGNEDFVSYWADANASQITCLIYDMLVYWDEVNKKVLPGLAEKWELAPDAMTLTMHLRKGVQFSDGWGELTSADVKYTYEKLQNHGGRSRADTVPIGTMDTPDPYTLVFHFKTPSPTFLAAQSPGNSGAAQGIICKKYLDTVGEDVAGQKPVGTGPYRLGEGKFGSYYKLEALDSHWRVVPEFKTITLRMVSEISTTVAMLKTGEIDLAMVSGDQLANLKAAGLGAEVYPAGATLDVGMGGLYIPEDRRYDPAVHNKDPWVDSKVRKAMAISIDREAISSAIFLGAASPVSVPITCAGWDKYQYPNDPAAARQLLKDAGYPNGFSFNLVTYVIQGIPETPRLVEVLANYWQQIGLDPRITAMDYATYNALRQNAKTAGYLAVYRMTMGSDPLSKAATNLMPNGPIASFQDEGSYAIYKEGIAKMNPDEREAYADKLNQYFYENVGPIPLVGVGSNWAWNTAKVSPFPHPSTSSPYYLEYVRHAQPLNTFRLFTPWEGR